MSWDTLWAILHFVNGLAAMAGKKERIYPSSSSEDDIERVAPPLIL